MTVIVGLVGENGAVMAADTQATEADQTRHEVEKIWESHGLLFGYSGYAAIRDELRRAFDEPLDALGGTPDRHQARDLLTTATLPVLQHEYGNFIATKPGQTWGMLAGAMLVIGRDDGGFWLLEIDGNNTATSYTDRGFHTVGTGSGGAQVAYGLLEHHDPKLLPIRTLRLMAYRAVDVCIRVLGPMAVGGSVNLWSSTDEGFGRLDEPEAFAAGVAEQELAEREAWRKPQG